MTISIEDYYFSSDSREDQTALEDYYISYTGQDKKIVTISMEN